jgi:hypothetical protein
MSIAASAMKTRASGERQRRRQRRHDRRRAAHRAEDEVGRHAEDRRRVVRDDGVLVKELPYRVVRQEQRRRRLVLQPGAALVDPADQQRRQHQRDDELEQLRKDVEGAHRTKNSSASKVQKL